MSLKNSMKILILFVIVQLTMSDNDNKPPDLPDSNKEDDKSSVDLVNLNTTDKCDNPGSLMDYKNLMLKNKFDLKKKEEEVQVILFI